LEDLGFWPVTSVSTLKPRKQLARERFLDKWLRFSPDGKTLACGGGLKATGWWNIESEEQLETGFEIPAFNTAILNQFRSSSVDLAYQQPSLFIAGPAGDNLAVAVNSPTQYGAYSVALLSSHGRTIHLEGHFNQKISALAFSRDGHLLAAGSSDGKIRVWDLEAETELYNFQSLAGIVRCLAISPDNQVVISGSEGGYRCEAMLENLEFEDDDAPGMLYIWSLQTGKFLKGMVDRGAPVRAVEFNPDGKTVATINGSSIFLWDLTE
jgi:WD40 repeat protein